MTVLAALLPALRAARVPPVAAMREAATADRPLTRPDHRRRRRHRDRRRCCWSWVWPGTGDDPLLLVLGGVLVGLVGVALLTPLLCRPVVSLVGRLFSWSVPGKLGRRNSSRNPRRTAITAAAVMIGIALVTGVSTIVVVGEHDHRQGDRTSRSQADMVIAGAADLGDPAGARPGRRYDKVRALPDVQTSAAVSMEIFAKIDGKGTRRRGRYDDWAAARRGPGDAETGTGDIGSLDRGEVIVDEDTAKDRKLDGRRPGDARPAAGRADVHAGRASPADAGRTPAT